MTDSIFDNSSHWLTNNRDVCVSKALADLDHYILQTSMPINIMGFIFRKGYFFKIVACLDFEHIIGRHIPSQKNICKSYIVKEIVKYMVSKKLIKVDNSCKCYQIIVEYF